MTETADPRIAKIQEIKAYASMGTDGYHRVSSLHPKRFVLTSNAKALAEAAEANWLIDAIASWQREIIKIQKPYPCPAWPSGARQFWKLTVNDDGTATLTCEGELETEIVRQEIPYTDYPLREEKIWVFPGSTEADGYLAVCMLPSEY